MQAQVAPETIKLIKSISIRREPQKTTLLPKNYLQLKNQICKDTFHIGC